MKIYDKNKNRLIFLIRNIKNVYWDFHWLKTWDKIKNTIFVFDPNALVCKITPRFLKSNNGPLLEGGCGLGGNVFLLKSLGFETYGIDSAYKTVEIINAKMPSLKISVGDIRKIPFSNDFFAGYWSLGVIEHFFNGYEDVVKEMVRVIKSKGFLFITFPYFSLLRKLKARFNLYKRISKDFYDNNQILQHFYQYIFDKNEIIKEFEKSGFVPKYSEVLEGIKGFKDEIFFLKFFFKRFFQLLYDSENSKIMNLIKSIFERILVKFSAHITLLVFQKL
ncbi:MAG: class I SAM-dependent methyltransferase [Promethearchaeota archaeon]